VGFGKNQIKKRAQVCALLLGLPQSCRLGLQYALRAFPCAERSGELGPVRGDQVEEKGKKENAVSPGGKNKTKPGICSAHRLCSSHTAGIGMWRDKEFKPSGLWTNRVPSKLMLTISGHATVKPRSDTQTFQIDNAFKCGLALLEVSRHPVVSAYITV
jgi:hypothetical protein